MPEQEQVREPEMVPELEQVLELELERVRVLEQVWVPVPALEQEPVLVEHSRLGPRQ